MPKTFVKTQTLYTVDELEPSAYQKAYEKFVQDEYESGMFWTDEIMDSLKAVFKWAGLTLENYEISFDYPSSSYVRFWINQDEAAGLSGPRAQAWLENNLLADLRLPDHYQRRWKKCDSVHGIYSGQPSKYGYRTGKAGEIKSCPFTGVCFDDDFIDALIKSVNSGDTIKEAFESLAYVAGKLGEDEIRAALSEESFKEACAANGWMFNERGIYVWDAGEEQE